MAIDEQRPQRGVEYVDLQKGYPLLGVLTVTSLVTLASTWFVRPPMISTLVLIPQLALFVCYCSLFIRVTDGCLTWQFGPGWIRGKVLLSQVVTTRIVRSRFVYGWGFHRSIRGWRFYRGGGLAIEIQCQDGKRLRLGTTRAHELQHVIERARGRRPRLS